MIRVQVRLASAFQSREEVALHHALEEALVSEVGEVTGVGAGSGAMDVSVWVESSDVGVMQIDAIARRLGIGERTSTYVVPLRVQVRISCGEDEFPQGDALAPREDLIDAIELAEIGKVFSQSQEHGGMLASFDVQDVEVAIARIEAIVKEFGLSDRTTIREY